MSISHLGILALAAALVALGPGTANADDERLKNAALVLEEMAGAADTGIPQALFAKARCVVIVPSVRRLALGVGGQYGRGYIACRQGDPPATVTERGETPPTPSRWSPPGAIRIEGGSVGLQIGGSETDVILLVMNERGADRLLSSRFTVGAEASVAAGPVGRQAAAQTDATMLAEILAWSRSRGIFAGISLQGSTLREDGDENRELYGRELPNRDIVAGKVEPTPGAKALMTALGKY
jgi:lipid-binding SYLF domain-containing protein